MAFCKKRVSCSGPDGCLICFLLICLLSCGTVGAVCAYVVDSSVILFCFYSSLDFPA